MKTQIVIPDRESLQNFCGIHLLKTVRAVAAVRDEKVIGIVGLYSDSYWTRIFSNLTDELRRDKRAMVKMKRAIMAIARPRAPIYAEADPNIEGSARLLEHMGFQPAGGNLYVWNGEPS